MTSFWHFVDAIRWSGFYETINVKIRVFEKKNQYIGEMYLLVCDLLDDE